MDLKPTTYTIEETREYCRKNFKLKDIGIKTPDKPMYFKSGKTPDFLFTAVEVERFKKEEYIDLINFLGYVFDLCSVYEIYDDEYLLKIDTIKGENYYIPDPSEFHIGFEYEFQGDIFNGTNGERLWGKVVLDKEHISHPFNNPVRVKYLDKEDIESLGWVENKEYFFLAFDKHPFYLAKNDTHSYRIERKGVMILFSGIINNKSELHKLMKQLQII